MQFWDTINHTFFNAALAVKTISMKYIHLVSLSIFLFACNQSATNAVAKDSSASVSTDSLVARWNAAWNKHDSAAIVSLMDTDVQLVSGNLSLNGKADVSKNFVDRNYKWIADLKTEKLKSFTANNLAYEIGRYAHKVKRNDSIIGNSKGKYAFVWNKSDDNKWMLKVVEIEAYPAEK